MAGIPVKKLILVPTVILTVLLALAFVAPAAAAGVLRTVAPVLSTGSVGGLAVVSAGTAVGRSGTVGAGVSGSSRLSTSVSTGASERAPGVIHTVSTSGQQ